MTDTDTILTRWSALYVRGQAQKDHLTPECPYVGDHYRKAEPEAFPAGHVDLCSWCEQHFKNWEAGLSRGDAYDPSDEPVVEGSQNDVSEAYTDRPEPSEPYRYRCPDCESPCITTKAPGYRCEECGSAIYNKPDLIDMRDK